MAGQRKIALAAACAALVALKQSTFVPPARQAAPIVPASALAGSAAVIGATPAFADEIGDAAKKLSDASYPFLKEVDWNSLLFLAKPGGSGTALDWLKAIDTALVMGNAMDPALLKKGVEAHIKGIKGVDAAGVPTKADYEAINAAIGRMIASVPEDKTMAVFNSFSSLVGKDVPAYMMSKVKAEDAEKAYSALMEFKEVVKTHPISHADTASAPIASGIASAASKLSSASYPFIKEVDWTSDIFSKPLPGVSAKQYLKGVDAALQMGAQMDPKALHGAVEAHHKAIAGVDSKGVLTASDYEAVNAALGQLIASTPASKTMDVYNAFAKILSPDVGKYMMAMVNADDAKASYAALLEFKDAVKAAQR